jgi:polysaccharide pyruvyl transferase WcaK-like protein
MKKVYLVGRALLNSGDHLIYESTKNLLRHYGYDITYENKNGNKPINDEELILINKCDYLIITGGPCITRGIYGSIYPLRKNLTDIKSKIILFGVGRGNPKLNLNNADINFLKRCIIFTRDVNTQLSLNDNGIKSGVSGCSVWYNSGDVVKEMKHFNKNKVLFSTSIFPDKYNDILYLKIMINNIGKENIIVSVNHGINHDGFINSKIRHFLDLENIFYVDTNSNCKLMRELTEKVDYHVGFRLHNHLLALSFGVKSFVINIDNRGVDMCNFLGNKYGMNYADILDFENNLSAALNSDYIDVINIINTKYNYVNDIFRKQLNTI